MTTDRKIKQAKPPSVANIRSRHPANANFKPKDEIPI